MMLAEAGQVTPLPRRDYITIIICRYYDGMNTATFTHITIFRRR